MTSLDSLNGHRPCYPVVQVSTFHLGGYLELTKRILRWIVPTVPVSRGRKLAGSIETAVATNIEIKFTVSPVSMWKVFLPLPVVNFAADASL